MMYLYYGKNNLKDGELFFRSRLLRCFILRESRSMKIKTAFAVLLIGAYCAIFGLCSCKRVIKDEKTVDPETLHLMQKTQAELAACVDRCRSAAAESKDREILLALANSQQILADRHETIIKVLLKKYKQNKISTFAYPIEMDPRMMVLSPLDEYKDYLAKADPKKTLREVLIALEITNKVLENDQSILGLIDPDSEYGVNVDFHLCPVCGMLFTSKPEENCPVCNSDKEKIIFLNGGEIPRRDNESFVIVSE